MHHGLKKAKGFRMKVIIQCAAKKQTDAGTMRTPDGSKVRFRAHPNEANPPPGECYAHPDDVCHTGRTWREELLTYNADPGDNPLELLPAWQLYANPAYRALEECGKVDELLILSAGWGLIPASFLTPDYDITFSPSASHEKRRRKRDRFDDYAMLVFDSESPLLFFGGKDYFGLFASLTEKYRGRRIAVYNSINTPAATGVECRKYATRTKTNWHYEAVRNFVSGEFVPVVT
jgi:hypothetical protein